MSRNGKATPIWRINKDGSTIAYKSLSETADMNDLYYKNLHDRMVQAAEIGMNEFMCKGGKYTTEEPQQTEPEQPEPEPLLVKRGILNGLCTHRLGVHRGEWA